MKHRRTRNPFPRILHLTVLAVIAAFGFALVSGSPAQAAWDPSPAAGSQDVPVSDPVASGEFDVPTCDDLNGDRHQPTDKGYRWSKDITAGTVTLSADLTRPKKDHFVTGEQTDYVYTIPADCADEPAVDRSKPVDRPALPATGADDSLAHDAVIGMAYGSIILLAGLAIVAGTRSTSRGRHRA